MDDTVRSLCRQAGEIPLNTAKSPSPFPHSANLITTIIDTSGSARSRSSVEVVERLNKTDLVEAYDVHD